MEENFDALEVIARTRGKVEMDDNHSGNWLFPLWGWLAASFYLAEFILLQFLHQDWAVWLWVGIPAIGMPLMARIISRDRQRTHMRTKESKLVLDYWIFAACVIGIAGFIFGFAGLYEIAENPVICLLIGAGAFITGTSRRFAPMIAGGLVGTGIGIGTFLLQGELWPWQALCVALCAVASLIIPGHLYEKD